MDKSIYDPKSMGDGFRVLVMQYWPRGVKKERIDAWYRELGTSKELIKAWKGGRMAWSQFRKRYLAELEDENKQQLIRQLAQRAKTEKITLLCGCRDPNRCHRSILKDAITKARPLPSSYAFLNAYAMSHDDKQTSSPAYR